MMSDNFIEGIISVDSESTNRNETMISRELNGMEAVAKYSAEDSGKPVPASEEGGDN